LLYRISSEHVPKGRLHPLASSRVVFGRRERVRVNRELDRRARVPEHAGDVDRARHPLECGFETSPLMFFAALVGVQESVNVKGFRLRWRHSHLLRSRAEHVSHETVEVLLRVPDVDTVEPVVIDPRPVEQAALAWMWSARSGVQQSEQFVVLRGRSARPTSRPLDCDGHGAILPPGPLVAVPSTTRTSVCQDAAYARIEPKAASIRSRVAASCSAVANACAYVWSVIAGLAWPSSRGDVADACALGDQQ
jgi:hypothetical protein